MKFKIITILLLGLVFFSSFSLGEEVLEEEVVSIMSCTPDSYDMDEFNIPYDGLVSYWNFEKDFNDVHGGYKVKNQGGEVLLLPGPYGNYASFDGIDDYLDYGTYIPAKDIKTISFWVKFDDVNPNFVKAEEIISKSSFQRGIEVLKHHPIGDSSAGSTLSNYVMDANDINSTYHYMSNFNSNDWYHVVVTQEGEGHKPMKMYVDGVLVSEVETPQTISDECYSSVEICLPSENNILRLLFGRWNFETYVDDTNYVSPRYFDGSIDEVAIWNRALSESEVVSLSEEYDFYSLLNLDYNINWYKVLPDGSLYDLDKHNVELFVYDLDSNIYVCEVFADDGEEESLPFRKSFTLLEDRTYLPYGSFEPELNKLGPYHGRERIPQSVLIQNNLSYSLDYDCDRRGECGIISSEGIVDSSYLDILYRGYFSGIIRKINNNDFNSTLEFMLDSDFDEVYGGLLDTYVINSEFEEEFEYRANLYDVLVNITYIDGTSEIKSSDNEISLTPDVKNVTLNPKLKISHVNNLVPPYLVETLSLFTFTSDDETVLKQMSGDELQNVFELFNGGNVNVTVNAIPGKALGEDINYTAEGLEKIVVFKTVDVLACPNRLDAIPPKIDLVFNNTMQSVRNNFTVWLEVDNELNYVTLDQVSNSFNTTSIQAFLDDKAPGYSVSEFTDKIHLSSGEGYKIKLNFDDELVEILENVSQYTISSFITYTYKQGNCPFVSDTQDLNVTEGDLGCYYVLGSNPIEYFYFRESRPVSVIKRCDGQPDESVDSADIYLRPDINLRYSYFDGSKCGSLKPVEQGHEEGDVCYQPRSASDQGMVDIDIKGQYSGLSFEVIPDCAYNSITSTDPNLEINVDDDGVFTNELYYTSDFDLSNISLDCKARVSEDKCVAKPSLTFLESLDGRLLVNGLNLKVDSCAAILDQRDLSPINLSYNGNEESYCDSNTRTILNFRLPTKENRKVLCTDTEVGLEEEIIKDHVLYLSRKYSEEYGNISNQHPEEVTKMVLDVLDDPTLLTYTKGDLRDFFNYSIKRPLGDFPRYDDVVKEVRNVPEGSNAHFCGQDYSLSIYDCIKEGKNRDKSIKLGRSFPYTRLDDYDEFLGGFTLDCNDHFIELTTNSWDNDPLFTLTNGEYVFKNCKFRGDLLFEVEDGSVSIENSDFYGSKLFSDDSRVNDFHINTSNFYQGSAISESDLVYDGSYLIEKNDFEGMSSSNAYPLDAQGTNYLSSNYCGANRIIYGCSDSRDVLSVGEPVNDYRDDVDSLFSGVDFSLIDGFVRAELKNSVLDYIHYNRIKKAYFGVNEFSNENQKEFVEKVGDLLLNHKVKSLCNASVEENFASVSFSERNSKINTLNRLCPILVNSIIFDPGFYLENNYGEKDIASYILCTADQNESDIACCPSQDACVYEGKCSIQNEFKDFDFDLVEEVCVYD